MTVSVRKSFKLSTTVEVASKDGTPETDSNNKAKSMSVSAEPPSSRLHRCSFFPYKPSSIKHLACTPDSTLPQVAVLRASEPPVVEIWCPGNDWAMERIIPGRSGEDFECVAFVGPATNNPSDSDSETEESPIVSRDTTSFEVDLATSLNRKHILPLAEAQKLPRARVFTASVDGRIREWNNSCNGTREEISSVDVAGGAIWCMAVSPDQNTLAVGSEDGRVRLFSILPSVVAGQLPSIEFLRGFEAGEANGRILSLAWNATGSRVVSGSSNGMLKLWECTSGRASHSIRLSSKQHSALSVWSVSHFTAPNGEEQLISGDSSGKVVFWDARTGTQLQSFPAFGADVLCVSVVGGERVFASGVDHKIVEFSLVKSTNAVGFETFKWIQGGKRYYHTHDVRALDSLNIKYTAADGRFVQRQVLVSGGNDCVLVASSPESFDRSLDKTKHTSEQRRLLPFSRISPIIQLSSEPNILTGKIGNSLHIWKIGENARNLAEINISRHESINSFSVSSTAKTVVALTASEVRLFRLNYLKNETECEIERLPDLPEIRLPKNSSIPHMCQLLDDDNLLLLNSHVMMLINLSSNSIKSMTALNSLPARVRRIVINPSKSLIALSTEDQVFIYSMTNETIKHAATLPALDHAVTAINFETDSVLIASTCRNAIYRFDVTTGKVLSELLEEFVPQWKTRREPIMGIQANPLNTSKVSCWTDSCINQFELPTITKDSKRKTPSATLTDSISSRIIEDYRPLIFFGYLNNGDVVVVERPWMSIVENLPAAYYRSRYGAQ